MNIFNMFWAFIAFVIGLVIDGALWLMMVPFITALYTVGTTAYYIAMVGVLIALLLFVPIIPLAIALDDEGRVLNALHINKEG